jgi:vacuolar-type H+-ATPase subunit H
MGMNNMLSLTERLTELIKKAEAEANEILSKAQSKSENSISEARKEADRIHMLTQRRIGLEEFLAESEAEAEKEAKNVTENYNKRVMEIKNTSETKIKEAVEYILSEVLPK